MKKVDARSLSSEVQQHLRYQAIDLFNKGKSRSEIAEIVGVNYSTVLNWIRVWKASGEDALELGKRGRRSGDGRLLTLAQEEKLKSLIIGKMPDQLKLPFALWTRKSIRDLAYQLWRIDIKIRTVGDYLKRWGFTPQKPAKQAYERNTAAVNKWLELDYPRIVTRAKQHKATIYWADEAGVKNQCQHGRSYAPSGVTPVQVSTGKQLKLNMVSAITNQGEIRFMTYTQKMNADLFIEFLKRVVDSTKGKAFVILDNLKVHHAAKVKQWVAENDGLIELYYLPSYSPDLNPDEYLNCDLKASVADAPAAKTQKEFEKIVRQKLHSIQKQPARVKKYFNAKPIRYAA